MLLRVQFGEEQKYVKLSELTFNAFLKEGGYSKLKLEQWRTWYLIRQCTN